MEVQSLWLLSQEPFLVPVVSYKNPVDTLPLLKFPHTVGLTVKNLCACLISEYVLQVSI